MFVWDRMRGSLRAAEDEFAHKEASILSHGSQSSIAFARGCCAGGASTETIRGHCCVHGLAHAIGREPFKAIKAVARRLRSWRASMISHGTQSFQSVVEHEALAMAGPRQSQCGGGNHISSPIPHVEQAAAVAAVASALTRPFSLSSLLPSVLSLGMSGSVLYGSSHGPLLSSRRRTFTVEELRRLWLAAPRCRMAGLETPLHPGWMVAPTD